jgi:hypothetical protein
MNYQKLKYLLFRNDSIHHFPEDLFLPNIQEHQEENNENNEKNLFLLILLISVPVLFVLLNSSPALATTVFDKTKKIVSNQTKTIQIDPEKVKTVLRKRGRYLNPVLDKKTFAKEVALILYKHWVQLPSVEKIFVPTLVNQFKNEGAPRFMTNSEVVNSMRHISLRNAAKLAKTGKLAENSVFAELTKNIIKLLLATNTVTILALVSKPNDFVFLNRKNRRKLGLLSILLFVIFKKSGINFSQWVSFLDTVDKNQKKLTIVDLLKIKLNNLIRLLIKNKYSVISCIFLILLIIKFRKQITEMLLVIKSKITGFFETVKTELPELPELPKVLEIQKERNLDQDQGLEITEEEQLPETVTYTPEEKFFYADEYQKISHLKNKFENLKEKLENDIYSIQHFGTGSKREGMILLQLIENVIRTENEIQSIDRLIDNIPQQFQPKPFENLPEIF